MEKQLFPGHVDAVFPGGAMHGDVRLFGQLHAAFTTACDLGDAIIAQSLLHLMEHTVGRQDFPPDVQQSCQRQHV